MALISRLLKPGASKQLAFRINQKLYHIDQELIYDN